MGSSLARVCPPGAPAHAWAIPQGPQVAAGGDTPGGGGPCVVGGTSHTPAASGVATGGYNTTAMMWRVPPPAYACSVCSGGCGALAPLSR